MPQQQETLETLALFREAQEKARDYLEEAENILIIHGTADEVVPFDSSRAFAENNVIDFIPVEKADHRFQNPAHRSAANKYTLEFFDMQ